jgi:putative tryptophan/tyrosine transport system substrate-binding protein
MTRSPSSFTMLLSRHTRRRAFIAGLGGAAVWPLVARAQQPTMPVIGFLYPYAIDSPVAQPYFNAFRQAMREAGYVEGKNVAIEYRGAEGHYDRLPELAAELVRLRPAVLVAAQLPAALAARAASTTIPIVFTAADDPVKSGLVESISQPGGNTTGINPMVTSLDGKRLGLLHELAPGAAVIGVLFNPNSPDAELHLSDLQEAGRKLGLQLFVVHASSEAEFDKAFAAFQARRAEALLIAADPLFSIRAERLAALAARYALPAVYQLRLDALAGGLMSYGPNLMDSYRQLGVYTARVLNGENPGQMPVWQAVKFELVINLKTAKALGLEIPPQLLARADEVIE